MSLADRIIDHGPYLGGDDSPFAGGVDYADLNDLRDRLIAGRGVSPEGMQRFEVKPLESLGRGVYLGISHIGCPHGWGAEVDDDADFATLAELVQRAEEHGEVCR